MADKPRVRLEYDVEKMVEENATSNGRTLPAEVNYALRKFYTYQDNVKTMGKIVKAQRKGAR